MGAGGEATPPRIGLAGLCGPAFVVGVITKEHVADSVAESVQIYPR